MKAYNLLIIMLLTLFTISCKKEENAVKKIAGENSKKWEAVKELNSEGKKDKLSKDEQKEIIQFYSNGTFTINGVSEGSQGNWNYDEASKNLSMIFGSTNFSENFTVLELKEDKMKLKAGDGSMLVMEEMDE